MKRSVKSVVSVLLSFFMIVSLLQISTLTVKADGKVEDIFTDINGDEWFVPFVQFVYDNGLMSGKGEIFDPNGKMQREEITQIVYNMAGKPEIPADAINPFSDVASTDWFYKGVIWCSINGIAGGVGNGKFGKGQKITRQDFALMLYKYAELTESPSLYNIDNSAIEGYADTDKIKSYAKTAMNWAVSNGLMSGKGNSGAPKSELRLDPTGDTTRAEGATLITRFSEADKLKVPQVGDIIKYGKYEQDGNFENGKEVIEWQVLKVESNRALVISKYAIERERYDEYYRELSWDNSSLRKFLNEDFIHNAFSEKEIERIPTVTLQNKRNPLSNVREDGNDTEDKVFCLSLEETESLFGNYNQYDEENHYGFNQNLICSPTNYAVGKGAHTFTITEDFYNENLKDIGYTSDVIGVTGAYWFVRTTSISVWNTLEVAPNGCFGAGYTNDQGPMEIAVRPAMYIDFD